MPDTVRAGELAAVLARLAGALAGHIDLDELLPQVVTAVRRATGAHYAALGVLAERTQVITRFVHEGMDPKTVEQIGLTPTGGGLLGELIRHPQLITTDDLDAHPAFRGFPEGHPPMANFLGTPIRAGGRVFGNLYLTDKPGGFTAADIDVVTVLAAQAGLAISAAQMARDLRDLAVQEERNRISRDLHDGVIQVLFSTGMALEALRSAAGEDSKIGAGLDEAVRQLDDTIHEIRQTIFELRPERSQRLGLEHGLAELVKEYRGSRTIEPSVQVRTALDGIVPDEVIPDVLHIVREALSNAAKHAGPTSVQIVAEVVGGVLSVAITDHGRGFDTETVVVGHGLGNMAERAALLDAELHLDAEPGRGATVRLRVPLIPWDET